MYCKNIEESFFKILVAERRDAVCVFNNCKRRKEKKLYVSRFRQMNRLNVLLTYANEQNVDKPDKCGTDANE